MLSGFAGVVGDCQSRLRSGSTALRSGVVPVGTSSMELVTPV